MSVSKRRRWPRVIAGTASAFVLLATGVAGAGAIAYQNLDDNIRTQDISSLLGPRPDRSADTDSNEPLNILLMGSDTRIGADNGDYGSTTEIQGARSDTTILLHVSGDRKSAFAVSIPRDSKVQIPACTDAAGQPVAPQQERFNEAFNDGGAACTVKTVEALTGVYIDHFMLVDFTGFKGVVEALGGVEVCVNEPVDDPLSGLTLPAGKSTLTGEKALSFVRARYSLGDGSDIGRISRQQDFLASALRKATSTQILTNPVRLYRVLDRATSSLTTDPGLGGLEKLQDLATSMSGISPSKVTFLTVPWTENEDHATISWDRAKADQIWQAMKDDSGWPPPPTVPQGEKALTVAPADIRVRVLNATKTPGRAEAVATDLQRAGYQVVETGGFPNSDLQQTQLYVPPGDAEAARTLAYALQTKAVRASTDDSEVMTVIVGADYTGVLPVVTMPKPAVPGAPTDTTGKNAAKPVCS